MRGETVLKSGDTEGKLLVQAYAYFARRIMFSRFQYRPLGELGAFSRFAQSIVCNTLTAIPALHKIRTVFLLQYFNRQSQG